MFTPCTDIGVMIGFGFLAICMGVGGVSMTVLKPRGGPGTFFMMGFAVVTIIFAILSYVYGLGPRE